jgi:hypothetical protein
VVKRGLLCLLVIVAAGLTAAAASATPSTSTFGNGKWTPHTGNDSQSGLVTSSDESGSFGGATISDFPSDPGDVTALSFDYNASVSGGSGGSPRLVVQFDDGDAVLRPLTLTADQWGTVDGMSGNNWDSRSDTCGFSFAASWNDVVACHPGATITGMWVVNDSGWLYTSGITVVFDNITVNDTVMSGPGNSD